MSRNSLAIAVRTAKNACLLPKPAWQRGLNHAYEYSNNSMTTPMNEQTTVANITETGKPSDSNAAKVSSRRKFLGQVGAALAGGAVLGKAAVASGQEYNRAVGDTNDLLSGMSDPRVRQSFALRLEAARRDALIPVPPHTTNGDEARYSDKSGTYTKGVLQDGIGLVNPSAFQTLRHAHQMVDSTVHPDSFHGRDR